MSPKWRNYVVFSLSRKGTSSGGILFLEIDNCPCKVLLFASRICVGVSGRGGNGARLGKFAVRKVIKFIFVEAEIFSDSVPLRNRFTSIRLCSYLGSWSTHSNIRGYFIKASISIVNSVQLLRDKVFKM